MASQLERVTSALPIGFDALQAEARREGYRFIDRLAADWASRAMRFDRPGEMLLASQVKGALAGIGGLTVDPVLPGVLRMRRFYIRRRYRRTGVGRELATALLDHARHAERALVTVNAGAGSIPFWGSLGFVSDPRDGHSHIRQLGIHP